MKKTPRQITIVIVHQIVSLFGIYFGLITIKQFEQLVKGLIGLSVFYLILSLFFPPKDFLVGFPNQITLKNLVITFFLSIISF